MITGEGWFFANEHAPTAHYFRRGSPSSVCGLAFRGDAYPATQPTKPCLHCTKALERIAKVDTSATTEEDVQANRMRATITIASRERFAALANRERAHQLADDLLGGRVTLHGPVPIETVVCLAQAVADYRTEREAPDAEAAYLAWCDGGGLTRALQDDADGTEASEVAAFYAGMRAARIRCDGDHPMPVCGDPQCWHRDPSRVLAKVDRIVEALLTGTAAASHPAVQHPTSISFSGYHESMSHVRWMLEALRTNEELRADTMKTWRWVGSVFGILIGLGYMTIDDCRRIVTNA